MFATADKNALFGAKVSQEIGSRQVGLMTYIHLTQGSIDTTVNVSHTLGDDKGMPKLTFIGKHQVDKDLSVKASITDSLEVKAAAYYKVSPVSLGSIGLTYKNGAKEADNLKVGFKFAFSG